jgi:hypothetical protein
LEPIPGRQGSGAAPSYETFRHREGAPDRPLGHTGSKDQGAEPGSCRMAYPMTRDMARSGLEEIAAGGMTPAGLERYRLDRLCELRAVIDSLRSEREPELLLDVCTEFQQFGPV